MSTLASSAVAQTPGPRIAPPLGIAPAPQSTPTPQPSAVPPTAAAPELSPLSTPLSLQEAVRTTLRKHPALAGARIAVQAADASIGLSRSSFDATFQTRLSHEHEVAPLLPFEQMTTSAREVRSDETELRVGAAKRFTLGTTVLPSVSLLRQHNRFDSLGVPVAQRARAELTVTQPLLRGAGETGAASAVTAAQHSRAGAEQSVAHQAQLQVFDTLLAYFSLVSAEKELALFTSSQARAQRLVDETRVLVEADQRPRGDLRQLEGNLANRVRARLETERARSQAQHALRLAMGLDLEESANWQAQDGFAVGSAPTRERDELAKGALAARHDVLAANDNLAATRALLDGAEHNTLPALDLSLSVGYTGALQDDGIGPFFEAAGRNVRGVNAGAALSLELPLSDSRQEAERDLQSAQYRSAVIERDDLERNVRTQVARALDALRLSAAARTAAAEGEAVYTQALEDEREKLRAGLSTVIDVVLTEERLTEAELSRIGHELDYAVALAELRLALGTLPSTDAEVDAAVEQLLSAEASHGGR